MASRETRTTAAHFRSLDPRKVIETIATLRVRIAERFPGAGLVRVCDELLIAANENSARARDVARPNVPLRIAIVVVAVIGAGGLAWIVQLVLTLRTDAESVFSVLQGIEAAANLMVLIGAAWFFLARIEQRWKRREALAALHELRSIMHVIDMHQLTKDPSAMSLSASASSPARSLNRADTSRYLDYCSEMLSLSAKVAALFAQGLRDPTVIEAVSDIERLAAGLSQKIWQKIMILQAEAPEPRIPGAGPAQQ
jgi:hypothetical protein